MSASALPMAVTMGDPSGIGPEIVAKTLLQPDYARRCVVVGDAAVMARALDSLGAADRLRVVSDVARPCPPRLRAGRHPPAAVVRDGGAAAAGAGRSGQR